MYTFMVFRAFRFNITPPFIAIIACLCVVVSDCHARFVLLSPVLHLSSSLSFGGIHLGGRLQGHPRSIA
jgi:hypothetical protein